MNQTEMISLVEKSKNGNKEAFTTLVVNLKENIYRTIYAITQNSEDTLDVLNEVIYKSYVNLKMLDHNEFFKTWIIRIAINESRNYINKKSKVLYFDDLSENSEVETIQNEYQEVKMDIKQSLENLDETTRIIIIMKLYLEYTFEQISKTLNKPESTVKSAYYTGLEKIKKYLRIEEVN